MATHLGGAESGTRFASVTDDDIETLVANKDSKNTKKATKSAVAVFEQYLKAKKICCRFETVTPPELNDILKRFWVEARKQNGEKYTKTSLTSIRFGLWRFIKNCRPEMDIMSSPDFKQSNTALKAQTVQLKHEGKSNTNTCTILEEDLQKLCSQASKVMPVKLLIMSSVQCQTPLALLCAAISNSCTQKSFLCLQIL